MLSTFLCVEPRRFVCLPKLQFSKVWLEWNFHVGPHTKVIPDQHRTKCRHRLQIPLPESHLRRDRKIPLQADDAVPLGSLSEKIGLTGNGEHILTVRPRSHRVSVV